MVHERALVAKSNGPYFLGETFSFADIALAPFVDRFRYTLPALRGVDVFANAPRLRGLMAAIEQRESFKATAQPKEYYVELYKKFIS